MAEIYGTKKVLGYRFVDTAADLGKSQLIANQHVADKSSWNPHPPGCLYQHLGHLCSPRRPGLHSHRDLYGYQSLMYFLLQLLSAKSLISFPGASAWQQRCNRGVIVIIVSRIIMTLVIMVTVYYLVISRVFVKGSPILR